MHKNLKGHDLQKLEVDLCFVALGNKYASLFINFYLLKFSTTFRGEENQEISVIRVKDEYYWD